MTKKILYIDLDNTLVNFKARIDGVDPSILGSFTDPAEEGKEPKIRYDDIPGFFALMPPMPGALEAFRKLSKGFDTYILSTAPWDNPSAWEHKVDWVHLHIGRADGTPAFKRLILSHHKNLNKGHFLVDDRPHNGAKEFGDIDGQEWLHFGEGNAYPDWEAVLRHLLPKA